MRTLAMLMTLGLVATAGASGLRADDGPWAEERYERKEGEWKYEYKDRHREVKRERKAGGEWKYEYKDRHCEVKRELTSSGEYKEEIKCK